MDLDDQYTWTPVVQAKYRLPPPKPTGEEPTSQASTVPTPIVPTALDPPESPHTTVSQGPIDEPTGLRRTLLFAAVRVLLFIAWWFGAQRLDVDGDGDIDDIDVSAFLEDANILNKRFARTKKGVRQPGSPVSSPNGPGQTSPTNPGTPPASPASDKPKNDEGAPMKVGRDVVDGYDGSTAYYCGRLVGENVTPDTGQCGPLTGPQCPSCERFQKKQVFTPGQEVEARWPCDGQYYAAIFETARSDRMYRVHFADKAKGCHGLHLPHIRDPVQGGVFAILDCVTDAVDTAICTTSMGAKAQGALDDVMDSVVASDISGIEEEEQVVEHIMTGQAIPYFIGIQTFLAGALWLAFAMQQSIDGSSTSFWWDMAGLDSLSNGMTDLRSCKNCDDFRHQLWRWWTYQFTHVGSLHVLTNSLFNVIFGVPMEGIHGSLKLALMYNIGVLGGACCYFVTSAHAAVVGMSGGCYSLLGMHIADLIMNWHSKRFRKPTIAIILGMVTVDLMQYFGTPEADSTSHAAHIGGCVAGVAIGLVYGKSLKTTWYRKYFQIAAFTASILLVCFCVIWMAAVWPPRGIWDTDGYCWAAQVHNVELLGHEWECVRCGSKACIERWQDERFISPVSWSFCEDRGWAISEQ